ncbi:MAG: zinc ribbon domain-containing protein [Pseudonocardiaceae bacterium]
MPIPHPEYLVSTRPPGRSPAHPAGRQRPLTLAQRAFVCETCGIRRDRDFNAAMNLAALVDQTVLGELRPDVKRPAGNPRQTAIGGNGYRHGKTQIMSQRRPREVAAP